MLTDIKKLIERLHADLVIDKPGYDALMRAADAQARLVAPLPAEVSETVRELDGESPSKARVHLRAARLLESQARENARLAAENAELTFRLDELSEDSASIHNERTKTRLAHQEERDRLRAELDVAKAALLELSQLGGGRSEGNWIAQRALAKLDAKKGGAT